MGEDGNIEFECIKDGCHQTVGFSLKESQREARIVCASCKNEYRLEHALVEKLLAFEHLVKAVKDARDILSQTSVGVTVGPRTIKVPYRLLLTRMTTVLDLKVGDQTLAFRFRVEPLKEDEIKSIQ